MSEESLSSDIIRSNSSQKLGRFSMEGSISLNDDLVESEYSSSSQSQNLLNRSPSVASVRNSIDGDSSFSSSTYFNLFNQLNQSEGESYELGPNSIYELTIASDLARMKKKRPPKSYVSINGGQNIVNNLISPTTKDIPPIHLSKLSKRVPNSELETAFLKKSLEEYKNFDSSYKSLTEATLNRYSEQDTIVGNLSATSSISDFQESEDNDQNSEIPNVYLDPEFRLDNPRIFNQVVENSNILPTDSEMEDSQNNIMDNNKLQEKISNYLDIVEIKLINAISKSSGSFFGTIEDIQNIRNQSQICVDKFNDVQEQLRKMDEEQSERGIKLLEKINIKNQVETLEASLLQLQYITSIFELSKKSFEKKKYSKCLKEVLVLEFLIEGIEYDQIRDEDIKNIYPQLDFPIINLSSLPALVNLRNDLQSLKDECAKGYMELFLSTLLDDLRSQCNSVSTIDTFNRIFVSTDKSRKYSNYKTNTSYRDIPASIKDELSIYINTLTKSNKIILAYSIYQERIITEIKDIIKNNLPSSKQNGTGSTDISNTPSRASSVPPENALNNFPAVSSTNSTLSANIKSLSSEEFLMMLKKIYAELSECLRRLTAHQKILLDLALTAIPPTQDVDVMSLDISTSINKAIELTQIRLTKVINVRSEQIADLEPMQYAELYAITSAYLQECELINPGYLSGPGNSLQEWFKQHVNYFVHRFHQNTLKNLVSDCEKETWKEVTNSTSLSNSQTLIHQLVEYSVFIESGGKSGYSGEDWLKPFNYFVSDNLHEQPEAPETQNISRLQVDNEEFMVPELVLKSIIHIRNYIIISKYFPTTSVTIESNLLNYLKLLNSRTSQAILNAGATRTAGLRHITTKHLALCIQLVEFYIKFVPEIQNIFKITQSQLNIHNQAEELNFTIIVSNFKDHENELFSKLVSIMFDRTLNHCTTITKIDWSQSIPLPHQCHPYMETLVKETLTVIKVLSKYLPEYKCSLIMSQIFENYKKQFVNCFCTQIDTFKDLNEKYKALKDIDYFRVKLCEAVGYGNSGQVVWENVNALPTIEDTQMENIMKKNIEGELKNLSNNGNQNQDNSKKENKKEINADSVEHTNMSDKLPAKTDDNKVEPKVVETPKKQEYKKEEIQEEQKTIDNKNERSKPEEGKPEEGKPEEGKLEEGKLEEGKLEEGKLEGTQLKEPENERSKPEDAKLEEAQTEISKPEEGKPGISKSKEGKPEEDKPEEDKLEERKPEEGKPEEDKLEEGKLEEGNLEGTQLKESQNERSKPEEDKPEEDKLEEGKTEEGNLEGTQLKESQNERSKPEEGKPEEAQTERSKPEEVIPVESEDRERINENKTEGNKSEKKKPRKKKNKQKKK